MTSIELIAKVGGESREQVRRYIRLTQLIPELLKIVDDTAIHDKKIKELKYNINCDIHKLDKNCMEYKTLIDIDFGVNVYLKNKKIYYI